MASGIVALEITRGVGGRENRSEPSESTAFEDVLQARNLNPAIQAVVTIFASSSSPFMERE